MSFECARAGVIWSDRAPAISGLSGKDTLPSFTDAQDKVPYPLGLVASLLARLICACDLPETTAANALIPTKVRLGVSLASSSRKPSGLRCGGFARADCRYQPTLRETRIAPPALPRSRKPWTFQKKVTWFCRLSLLPSQNNSACGGCTQQRWQDTAVRQHRNISMVTSCLEIYDRRGCRYQAQKARYKRQLGLTHHPYVYQRQ